MDCFHHCFNVSLCNQCGNYKLFLSLRFYVKINAKKAENQYWVSSIPNTSFEIQRIQVFYHILVLTLVFSQIKHSVQLVQLVQLAIPVIWVSVWARFLARSARAKLSSAQLAGFKIWKSSAQLSSPNSKSEKAQLSSARHLKGVSSAQLAR